jgi:RNA polymerase sigma factor (sigma-70 family)
MDDLELLGRYVKDGCAKSFGIVMRRHIGWVYSASLRQVGDAALAEDVTQSVFVLLTRRAADLGPGVQLRGWLFNTLRFVAREAQRKQGRRRRHEAQVALQCDAAEHDNGIDESAWRQMSPLLDEAVASLRETDRQAVLLRFYEGKNFAQVAEALGVSEVAARKRVSRAVARLSAFFKRRGVVLSAVMVGMLMIARTASAAPPAALLEALGGACGGGGGGAMTMMLVRAAAGRMIKARRRLAAAIVACMGLVGAGLWVIVTVWLIGDPSQEALPRLELPRAATAEQAVLGGRITDEIPGDSWSPPRRRVPARVDFEVTRTAAPVQAPAESKLDVIAWVTRWLDARQAADERDARQAAAARRGGAAGGAPVIDPVTGRELNPPGRQEAEDVNSFTELGASGGGGGGGGGGKGTGAATAVDAAANAGDSSAKSAAGSAWRGSVAEVVVASSSSATASAMPAAATVMDSGVLEVAFHPAANSTAVVLGGSQWQLSNLAAYYLVRSISGNVERYVVIPPRINLQATQVTYQGDLVVDGPAILVDLPPGSDQNSLAPFVRWLAKLDPDVTAAIGQAFPDGLNLGDPAQAAALDGLVTRLGQPELVEGWDGGLGATSVPEPGLGLLVVGVVGMLAARRRRRSAA